MTCHMLSAILLLYLTAGYLAALSAYWDAEKQGYGSTSFAGEILVLGILFVVPANLLLYILAGRGKKAVSVEEEK